MPAISPDSDVRASEIRITRGGATMPAPLRQPDPDRPRAGRPALRLVEQQAPPLLIAGADAARRGALLQELSSTMPEGTAFAQASTLAEVLEHAPESRMVILSGGLDDASARSLMRVLGQRHPTLPVVSVEGAGPGEL
jgi:hypothetical protein